jgi:hypothetical protein
VMEQRRHSEAADRLHRLAHSKLAGKLADALHEEAEKMIRAGYSREALYDDLRHLLLDLRRDGREDLEDEVMDLMDALVGYCAPSARL